MLDIAAESEISASKTLKWRFKNQHKTVLLISWRCILGMMCESTPFCLCWHQRFTCVELRLNQTVGPSQLAFNVTISAMASAYAIVHAEENSE